MPTTSLPDQAIDVFVLSTYVRACCLKVDRSPSTGESVLATEMAFEPGGKGLNMAVGLGRMGLSVASLTAAGADAAGDELVKLFGREGMGRAHCVRLGTHSGFGVGLLDAAGQNSIAVHPGANALLTGAHVREHAGDDIDRARFVFGTFEAAPDALTEALSIGRAGGAFNVVNPSPWRTMPVGFWAMCDGIIANETEAGAMLSLSGQYGDAIPADGAACADWLRWLHGRTYLLVDGSPWPGQWLIVTLGDQGSLKWRRGQRPVAQPAIAVTAIDTVGCGDAFACGVLTALSAGHDDQLALLWGALCGAHLATLQGVLDALPDRVMLEHMLSSAKATPL